VSACGLRWRVPLIIPAQFFKGVATVCTKLFNAVEVRLLLRSLLSPLNPQPDHAYFGQKDIQQALLLKMSTQGASKNLADKTVVADLLLAHPSADTLHILPTTRDPETNLALSSRNAYLSPAEMRVAPVLYRALTAAKREWQNGASGEDIVEAAKSVVLQEQEGIRREAAASGAEGVDLKPDYFEVFDKTTFEPVRGSVDTQRELVVAGAVWVGTTRLIDNLLLGWEVD
jgi:pantoate--beta-alanine ligase